MPAIFFVLEGGGWTRSVCSDITRCQRQKY